MENPYLEIDHIINAWAERHSLQIHSHFADRAARCAYVSNAAGECFQIWITPPANGSICVAAGCVEGRREDMPEQRWMGLLANLGDNLEAAYRVVLDWMAPSERFFPDS